MRSGRVQLDTAPGCRQMPEPLSFNRGVAIASYADDTQLLSTFGPDPAKLQLQFAHCMKEIANWVASNCLQLNSAKSKVVLFVRAQELQVADWWSPELGPDPLPKTW
ncbi:hypothetical protein NDU88_001217 [Pleurodeles waltl]|uniref:Reverse transcriptase domain-containing protein n=1 Tax=Pleurodeles waltl TaxID=8319 RepID=A0AAV7R8E0_PLEWA|nr:hypothetical protein NDU88_001217 [Pleurodeles waltl]